jgi:hypothetical protein
MKYCKVPKSLDPIVHLAISKPILSANILAQHRLLVNVTHHHVLHAAKLKPLSPPSIPFCRSSTFTASVGHIVPAVRELLFEFPAVISDGLVRPNHAMAWNILWRRQCSPSSLKLGGCTLINCMPPTRSSVHWRPLLSSATPIRLGRRHCIWYQKKKAHGGPLVITGG